MVMQTVQRFYVIIACCEDISDRYCIQKSNNDHFEWINEWRVEDERTTDVPSYIHFNMWTVSSDVSVQRRHWQPLSVHLWAYCTHPTRDVNDMMSEGWPQHRGLRLLLFSNSGVGSFTSHKNQVSVSAVRRDLRFFVLIRED